MKSNHKFILLSLVALALGAGSATTANASSVRGYIAQKGTTFYSKPTTRSHRRSTTSRYYNRQVRWTSEKKNKKGDFVKVYLGGKYLGWTFKGALLTNGTTQKVAGNGNYGVYSRFTSGPSHRVASMNNFKHGNIEANQTAKSSSGATYYHIAVDGHQAGWVNANFVLKNALKTAGSVNLVRNGSYNWNTRDAVSFATNGSGTYIPASQVRPSRSSINCGRPGTTKVTYRYGKAQRTINVTVRSDEEEGYADSTRKSPIGHGYISSWHGKSRKSSRNFNARHHFRPETKSNTYRSKGLNFTTRLFQPTRLSLTQNMRNSAFLRSDPESVAVSNGWMYTLYYKNTTDSRARIVAYNLRALGRFESQYINNCSYGKFKHLAGAIKVGPEIKAGHGQAFSATNGHLYIVADNNKLKNSEQSDELIQVDKNTLQVQRVSSFKITNDYTARYIHNATMGDDNTIYALFHNGGYGCYEIYQVKKSGNAWKPTEIGAINSNLSNSPIQGFTYSAKKHQFYIAVNDGIFRVRKDGKILSTHKYHTKRETEGLSANNNTLYEMLNQRAELLQAPLK